ncbi:Protein of unknown function [Reichenbachiella agariperforans]|uniref:DUF262 domain-containing protein n=1 Tax=Reichenbachiella agariperforans TaxID=156994 RepID=A0A1M6KYQ5_REIAG|nr:DUF262 domain-containing protein [Reichenbachiella agariperforans]SHJ63966.1 Protein of unknown function [Reichenbachiella agariperforans]
MNLDTSNRTYRQLVGNGLIYSVPRFQRDYSWTPTEWDDLWQDIEGLFEEGGEEEHYMGYLVLQSKDSKNFDVIDGQQRLTTLSILVLAFLGNLKKLIEDGLEPEKNQQRLDQLRGTFIGYLDPVTLIPKSKLNLNRNNNNLYQTYLVPLEAAPKRNLKATEHLMRKAYDWFFNAVKHKFSSNRRGDVLAQYIDSLSDKLFFTVITVNDELNAYKVFETLNARGVKLSSTDLLKNYLFAVVHNNGSDEREMTELDNRWERLVGLIGSDSLPDFLRTYWNSQNKFVRHSELFKRIRESISSKGEVFSLMRDLESSAHIFAALPSGEDALWTNEQKKYIKTLRMFNVRQLYPLLLSGYKKFSEADFTSLLRSCCVISFRYNIIGNLATNEQERVYNRLAVELSTNSKNTLQDLIIALGTLYVSDDRFRADFSEKELRTTQARNKRVVRYILFEIEKHVSNNAYDFESDSYNLEHIMPESIQEGWDNIEDRDHDQFVYRLGNMTILNKSVNRDLGNADFLTKKAKYQESEFFLTLRVANENSEWNPERIAEHQKWMARQATSIWRIAQLN